MHRHPHHPDDIDAAFDRLVEEAMAGYVRKQALFQARLAPFTRWGIEENETLMFSGAAEPALRLRIVPVGTYLPGVEDWAWAWANDVFPQALRERAGRVRALSEKTGYGIFERPAFKANGEDIDQLCALALHELGGEAIFKTKGEEPWCFYVVEPELDAQGQG